MPIETVTAGELVQSFDPQIQQVSLKRELAIWSSIRKVESIPT